MFAVVIIIIIVWICMWLFYKVMYPRAPKSMMPQKGDVTTPRACDFCGHSLAEYRGVIETKAIAHETVATEGVTTDTMTTELSKDNTLFFCNYEHQADFHAGRDYERP